MELGLFSFVERTPGSGLTAEQRLANLLEEIELADRCDEVPHGDIRKIDIASIPDHDVLAAGFPCQPFSIAGVSKRNSLGYKHGFEHPTQGTLFFNVQTIIGAKRPRMFLLENVKKTE